jgi:hypothetical protein
LGNARCKMQNQYFAKWRLKAPDLSVYPVGVGAGLDPPGDPI